MVQRRDGRVLFLLSYALLYLSPVVRTADLLCVTPRRSMEILRDALECHVVGVEYPGYGLTSDLEANEQR